MAKKSAVEKNHRRRRMADRYATRRSELRAIVHDRTRAPEERFEATLMLAKLPRNSAQGARAQPMRADRTPARLPQEIRHVAHRAARPRVSSGQIPGLVKASW